jgi:hypothetical protein
LNIWRRLGRSCTRIRARSTHFKHDKVSCDAFGDRDNTEVGTSSPWCRVRARYFVHLVYGRVNEAGHAVASVTLELDSPVRKGICKTRSSMYGIPPDFGECVPIRVGIGTANVGAPIANRPRTIAPYATLFYRRPWWIVVEAGGTESVDILARLDE